MDIKEIKKGDKILHSHLGTQPPVSGVVMESPKQGRGVRSTILVDVKGSEVGLFDEVGSIYTRAVSYTHLRAHETVLDLVCRLLL